MQDTWSGAGADLEIRTLRRDEGALDFNVVGCRFAEMYQRNLGVNINVEEVEKGFFEGLNDRQFQMFFIGWVADYPDPQNFLEILFRTDSDANHGGYSDPEVDRLLDQAGVEQDRDTRVRLYREAERKIVDAAPVVPLYHQTTYALVKARVAGLTWTPMGVLSPGAPTTLSSPSR